MKYRQECSQADVLEMIIRMVWQVNELPDQYVCMDYNGGIGFVQVYRAKLVTHDLGRKIFVVAGGTATIGISHNGDLQELWYVHDNLEAYLLSVGIEKLEVVNE